MRVDVYPTHRPVVLSRRRSCDNTREERASRPRSVDGGLGFENALPGYAVPDPEDRQRGDVEPPACATTASPRICKYDAYNVDSSGTATLSTTGNSYQEWPLYRPENIDKVDQAARTRSGYIKQEYVGPARRAGEALLVWDHVNPLAQPRKAWQYLPGQRRVKLAPDIAYDTPNPGVAGAATYDDAFVFNGAHGPLRLQAGRQAGDDRSVQRLQGDLLPGQREERHHAEPLQPGPACAGNCTASGWSRRRSSPASGTSTRSACSTSTRTAGSPSPSDQYDARGQLYRGLFAPTAFAYDVQAMNISLQYGYDLIAGHVRVAGQLRPVLRHQVARADSRRATGSRTRWRVPAFADAERAPGAMRRAPASNRTPRPARCRQADDGG